MKTEKFIRVALSVTLLFIGALATKAQSNTPRQNNKNTLQSTSRVDRKARQKDFDAFVLQRKRTLYISMEERIALRKEFEQKMSQKSVTSGAGRQ